MSTAQIETLNIANVRPSSWNSRVERTGDDDRLQTLADSMKKYGQQTPVQVVGPDDKGAYEIVFGNRRYAALKLAGITTIRAEVVPAMEPGVRRVRNVMENAVRQDLTTYEMARVCAELEAQGLTQKEIGQMVGFSFQSVSNHINCIKRLHKDIVDEWARGNEAATINTLRPIATLKSPEAQLKAWDEAVRRRVEAEQVINRKDEHEEKAAAQKNDTEDEEGGSSPIRALTKRLTEVIDLSSSRKIPQGHVFRNKDGTGGNCTKEWLRALAQWLTGNSDKRPAGFPVEEKEGVEE